MSNDTEARRKLREWLESHKDKADSHEKIRMVVPPYTVITIGDFRAVAAEPAPAPLPADVEEDISGLEEVRYDLPDNGNVQGGNYLDNAIALIRAQAATIAEQTAEIAALRLKAAAFDRMEGGMLAELLKERRGNVENWAAWIIARAKESPDA